jgi:transcriptional regulator with XRE-family HTH domain
MRRALARRDLKNVYRILQRHGMSQRWIAARTEQSQSEISEILTGRQVINYDLLLRIALGLGLARGWQCDAFEIPLAVPRRRRTVLPKATAHRPNSGSPFTHLHRASPDQRKAPRPPPPPPRQPPAKALSGTCFESAYATWTGAGAGAGPTSRPGDLRARDLLRRRDGWGHDE